MILLATYYYINVNLFIHYGENFCLKWKLFLFQIDTSQNTLYIICFYAVDLN